MHEADRALDDRHVTRPDRLTDDMLFVASMRTVEMLIDDGVVDPGDQERRAAMHVAQATPDFAGPASTSHFAFLNGYSLAKVLEKEFGWTVDAATVATLDAHGPNCRDVLLSAQWAWALANRVYPLYPAGTRVSWKTAGDSPILRSGLIVGVATDYPAAYLIVVDGRPETFSSPADQDVVEFERVRWTTRAAPLIRQNGVNKGSRRDREDS